MATSLLTAIVMLRSRIKLSFDMEAFWKSFFTSMVMAVAVVAVQVFRYSRFYLPVYVLIGGAVYLVMLRLTNAVKLSDVQLMEEYLGPRFSLLVRPFEKLLTGSQVQPSTGACGCPIKML